MTPRRFGAWVAGLMAVAALSACLIIDDDTASAQAACSRVCDCFSTLPSQQVGCVAECEDFAPQLTGDCLDCLAGLDCPDLGRGACSAECGITAESLTNRGDTGLQENE